MSRDCHCRRRTERCPRHRREFHQSGRRRRPRSSAGSAERSQNYVCISGVHGVMLSRKDAAAARHSQRGGHGDAGRHAAGVAVAPARQPPHQARLRAGPHAQDDGHIGRARLSAVLLWRRRRRRRAIAAGLVGSRIPASRWPAHICPPFRQLTPEEDQAAIDEINAARARHRLGGSQHAQAGILDGESSGTHRGAGDGRRRRGVRLPRRDQAPGAAVHAEEWPRMAVSHG